jgi:predicted O-methyltransferase YrrM
MSFTYPEHFIYPEQRIFFLDHVENWEKKFSDFGNEPRVCLEIGALYGGASVYILEKFCQKEGSHHYIMDINTNSIIQNNLSPYNDKVTYYIGESSDSFKLFKHNDHVKEFLDLVYIDGNHTSKYVLEDAVNAFYCLKNGGIMIFDDYNAGMEQEEHLRVSVGVDAFTYAYRKYIKIIHAEYQVIIQKVNYIDEFERKENYYNI